jgi:uncharacterized SAM-binding protein YcdF (DUF218 family)
LRSGAGAAAALGGLVAAGVRVVAAPRVDLPAAADAVLALDGDRPRRLTAAVALASTDFAPVLVVVRCEAVAPELLAARVLPFEVLSFMPEPSTTRGEARALARLVRERGWRRVLVVTSCYHVTRACLIFRRGVPCDLRFVSAAATPLSRLPRHVVSEWAKLALALTFRRRP